MKAAGWAVIAPDWPVANCHWPRAPRPIRPSLKPQRLGDDNGAPDLDALAAWQQRNAAYLPDALDLAAAIEQLRIEPDCIDCRQRLRAQLWRALQRPLPQAMRRSAADAMGQRYLDALEAQP